MTDETRAALGQAAEAMAEARTNAGREKKACLAQIAADLPTRAMEAAKAVAVAQPDVTKALGAEGVAEMRSALRAAAEELGRQFVAAIDEIKWPIGTEYNKVTNGHVHSALFSRFYKKTGALSKVLSTRGYQLGQSDPFIPQALYIESKFGPLAASLNELGAATTRFEKAKKNDDDSAVATLWGD